jgi:hypothetical protein
LFKKEGVSYNKDKNGSDNTRCKAKPSQNFTINLDTGVLTAQADLSQILYWCKDVNGYWFPSRYTNVEAAYAAGYSRHILEWKAKGPTGIYGVLVSEDGKHVTYDFNMEPDDQALNCVIRIPAIVSPVNHQLLTYDNKASFCNASSLNVRMQRKNIYTDLIDYNFKFDQKFGSSTDDIKVYLTTVENKLRLNQYQNTMLNPYVNKSCVIPYLDIKYSQTKTQLYTEKAVKTYSFNFDTMTEIPKYLLLAVSGYNAIYKDLRIFVNNNANIYTNISMTELFNATKRNGMDNYTIFDNSKSGYPNTWKKPRRNVPVNFGNGSILFLEYGVDIPLQNYMLMAGLGQVALTYTISFCRIK